MSDIPRSDMEIGFLGTTQAIGIIGGVVDGMPRIKIGARPLCNHGCLRTPKQIPQFQFFFLYLLQTALDATGIHLEIGMFDSPSEMIE